MLQIGWLFALDLFLVQFSPLPAESVYASYRKDFFYPYDRYPEAKLPDPVNGGRFQIVGVADASGRAGKVSLNGKEVDLVSGNWYVDWLRVYPHVLQKGRPFWVTFHSRDKSWDKLHSASFKLETSNGSIASSGTFAVALNPCNITYVTTDASLSTFLIHIRNGLSTESRTISQILVNGSTVTSRVKNNASLSVPPRTTVLVEIPLLARVLPGSMFTVAVAFAEKGSLVSVAAGRVAKAHFPIESWPKSDECPYPTINDSNYEFVQSHGFDTYFFTQNPCHTSKAVGQKILCDLAPKYNFYGLVDDGVPLDDCANASMALGIFIADEADKAIDDDMRKLLAKAEEVHEKTSSILTYQGGSRSRLNGAFAGITDIQGMDMYVAACAPHIQLFFHPPPLRGSYDYLRLTRNNHMPLPTWLYSQAFDDGWDAKIGDHVISRRQPDPSELLIQAMSVIAACAKGIMYFQSEVAENKYYHDSWKALGAFNRDVGAVREYLRTGDCTDMVTNSDGDAFDAKSIAQAIRSSNAIVVIVISVKNDGGYSDAECEIGSNEHWDVQDHTVDEIAVGVPPDFGKVVDSFEVLNGQIITVPTSYESSSDDGAVDKVKLSSISLPKDHPVSLYVLANSPQVRADVKAHL